MINYKAQNLSAPFLLPFFSTTQPKVTPATDITMPPERTQKTVYSQSTNPISRSTDYDPFAEYLHNEASEAGQIIKNDPYRRYLLKTGKHSGRTVKQMNDDRTDDERFGYLLWMLTNEKANRGDDDEHIVRRALLQCNEQAGLNATIPPSDNVPPVGMIKDGPPLLQKLAITVPSPERFKDVRGNWM